MALRVIDGGPDAVQPRQPSGALPSTTVQLAFRLMKSRALVSCLRKKISAVITYCVRMMIRHSRHDLLTPHRLCAGSFSVGAGALPPNFAGKVGEIWGEKRISWDFDGILSELTSLSPNLFWEAISPLPNPLKSKRSGLAPNHKFEEYCHHARKINGDCCV